MQQNFDPQKEMQVRMQKLLTENYFPVEHITPKWKGYAFDALRFASIIELGINPDDLGKIIDFLLSPLNPGAEKVSLHYFAIISNNLQRVCAAKLGISLQDYYSLMAEADSLVKIWQAEVKPLQEQMEKDFEEEMMQRAAEAKSKKHGLQPVKGEA